MKLFRKAKERKVRARALTRPEPAFVSIVKAGANQAPFMSVKMHPETGIGSGGVTERMEAMKKEGFEVERVVFTIGERFPDEEAIQKWIADGGYPIEALKELDDGTFELTNKVDFVDGSVVEVAEFDGPDLQVFVGKMSDFEDTEKGDEDESETSRAIVKNVELVGKKGEGEPETRKGDDGDDKDDPETKEADAHLDGNDTETVKPKKPKKKPKRKVMTVRERERTGAAALDGVIGETAGKDENGLSGFHANEDIGGGSANTDPETESGDAIGADPDKGVAAKDDEDGGTGSVITEDEASAIVDLVCKDADSRRAYMTEEQVKRFDDFMAHFSEATTVAGVLNDADDGLPPGFFEAVQATVVAMRNNLQADNIAAVKGVAVEFGNLVAALATVFASETEEKTQKAIDLYGSRLDEITPEVEDPEDKDEEVDAALPNLFEADGEGWNEKNGLFLLKAIGELAGSVEALAGKTESAIAEVKQQVTEARKSVDETNVDLASRLKVLEGERQTRKSADEDGEDGSTATKKRDPLAGIALRGALGISNVPPTHGGR